MRSHMIEDNYVCHQIRLQNAQLELTTGNHKSKENNFANLFKAVDDGIDSLHIKPSELVAMVGTGGAVAAGAAVGTSHSKL